MVPTAPISDSRQAIRDSTPLKGQESIPGKRNTGRQRQEGTVVRVVKTETSAAVRPLLVSQNSLPAVEHAAPTKPTQTPVKSINIKAVAAAETEATAAAAEHTAMLNRFRAEWQVTKRDSFWQRTYKHVEWRLFWVGHATAIYVLDYEERILFTLLYLAMLGLLVFEGCRRLAGGLQGLL